MADEMRVYVKYKQTILNEFHSPESWAWGMEYSFLVEAVSLRRPRVEFETINIAGPVQNGDTIWVMHILTNEGDSLGTARGKGEVIWAFKNEQSAKAAVAEVLACQWKPSLVFTDDEGETIQMSNPAECEIFARITDVKLTPLVVSDHIDYNYEPEEITDVAC